MDYPIARNAVRSTRSFGGGELERTALLSDWPAVFQLQIGGALWSSRSTTALRGDCRHGLRLAVMPLGRCLGTEHSSVAALSLGRLALGGGDLAPELKSFWRSWRSGLDSRSARPPRRHREWLFARSSVARPPLWNLDGFFDEGLRRFDAAGLALSCEPWPYLALPRPPRSAISLCLFQNAKPRRRCCRAAGFCVFGIVERRLSVSKGLIFCALQAWQRPTLPCLKTKYHWRRGV